MLTDVGRDDRFVFGQLVEFLDHELRLDDFIVLLVGERMGFFPFVDLLNPRRSERLDLRWVAVQ